MTAYDQFLIDEILPRIKTALKREENTLRKRLDNSDHEGFYVNDSRSISSTLFTERTLQYLIYKELCGDYKLLTEELSYWGSKQRMDIVIYKNIVDRENLYGEIGIELKCVSFNKNNNLRFNSLDVVIDDFDKIKYSENPNCYLLMIGTTDTKIDIETFDTQFEDSSIIDQRRYKKYYLDTIGIESFKTMEGDHQKHLNVILTKLEEWKS